MNRGPLDLQSNALPLSYCSIFETRSMRFLHLQVHSRKRKRVALVHWPDARKSLCGHSRTAGLQTRNAFSGPTPAARNNGTAKSSRDTEDTIDARLALSLDNKPLPSSLIHCGEVVKESAEEDVENAVDWHFDVDGKAADIARSEERGPSASTLHWEHREIQHSLHASQQRESTLLKPEVSINA